MESTEVSLEMVTQWSRQIWESFSIWQKLSTRRSSHRHYQIMLRDAEDMRASQAVGCRSESDMLSLLYTHLPCAFFKDAQPCWIKPLARLAFGTVRGDLGSEFRLPLLSPVCLFPLHPPLCEVSDSFFSLSSIWQDVLGKRKKCSTRTYSFTPRGGRGK